MTLPRNYGAEYISTFEKVYTALAAKHKVTLIPFFLEGAAGNPELNVDEIHPNEAGYRIVTANVLRYLEPMLKKAENDSGIALWTGSCEANILARHGVVSQISPPPWLTGRGWLTSYIRAEISPKPPGHGCGHGVVVGQDHKSRNGFSTFLEQPPRLRGFGR